MAPRIVEPIVASSSSGSDPTAVKGEAVGVLEEAECHAACGERLEEKSPDFKAMIQLLNTDGALAWESKTPLSPEISDFFISSDLVRAHLPHYQPRCGARVAGL